MDFTNSPRANPVIHQGMVYTLGAFGDLYCLNLDSGKVVWRKQLAEDFQAKRPSWGWSSTPLIVGDKLIVNPGAKDASLVALDRRTGTVLWSTPGDPPGYASFILATFADVTQIVGYDAASLGGWDPQTGPPALEACARVRRRFQRAHADRCRRQAAGQHGKQRHPALRIRQRRQDNPRTAGGQ
jgi:hypothetical protein